MRRHARLLLLSPTRGSLPHTLETRLLLGSLRHSSLRRLLQRFLQRFLWDFRWDFRWDSPLHHPPCFPLDTLPQISLL